MQAVLVTPEQLQNLRVEVGEWNNSGAGEEHHEMNGNKDMMIMEYNGGAGSAMAAHLDLMNLCDFNTTFGAL